MNDVEALKKYGHTQIMAEVIARDAKRGDQFSREYVARARKFIEELKQEEVANDRR